MRYLEGTTDYSLEFGGKDNCSNYDIQGYSDEDCAHDPIHRRSVSGYIFFKNYSPVLWNIKKQLTVVLSTTQADYMEMSTAAQEAL